MYKEFEELPVYRLAVEFSEQMYEIVAMSRIHHDFSFADQLRRATISITNNIAEGFERDSNNEFRYFLRVAKGSAGEVRSMLHLARKLDYISDEMHEAGCDQAKSISRQLAGFIAFLSRRD